MNIIISYRYTARKNAKSTNGYDVYAIVLDWPDGNILNLGSPITTPSTNVTLLGLKNPDLQPK